MFRSGEEESEVCVDTSSSLHIYSNVQTAHSVLNLKWTADPAALWAPTGFQLHEDPVRTGSGCSSADKKGVDFMQLSKFMWQACEAAGLFVRPGLMTPGRGNPSGSLMTHQASTQEHFHELLGPDSINLLLKIPQKHNLPKPPKPWSSMCSALNWNLLNLLPLKISVCLHGNWVHLLWFESFCFFTPVFTFGCFSTASQRGILCSFLHYGHLHTGV